MNTTAFIVTAAALLFAAAATALFAGANQHDRLAKADDTATGRATYERISDRFSFAGITTAVAAFAVTLLSLAVTTPLAAIAAAAAAVAFGFAVAAAFAWQVAAYNRDNARWAAQIAAERDMRARDANGTSWSATLLPAR